MNFTVVPALDKSEGETEAYYRIGVGSERTKVNSFRWRSLETRRLPKIARTRSCWGNYWQKLVRGKASIKQISGPIALARQQGDAVEEGLQERTGSGWFGFVTMIA